MLKAVWKWYSNLNKTIKDKYMHQFISVKMCVYDSDHQESPRILCIIIYCKFFFLFFPKTLETQYIQKTKTIFNKMLKLHAQVLINIEPGRQ